MGSVVCEYSCLIDGELCSDGSLVVRVGGGLRACRIGVGGDRCEWHEAGSCDDCEGGVSSCVLPGRLVCRLVPGCWAFAYRRLVVLPWRFVMSSCRHVVLLVVSCGLLVRASRAVPFRGGAVCGGDVLLVRFARLVVVPFALSSVLPVSFLSSSSSGMAMRDLCVGGLIRSSRGVWRSSCSGGRGCDFVSAALGSS